MEEKSEKKLTDIFKKVINTGVSAAFMTEDTVKSILSELPLPKDVVSGLLENAKNTRAEFVDSVKKELKTYLNKVDISKEVDRVLEKYDIEVSAKLQFKKKDNKDSKDS
jgi:uncharacterized protein (UPF0128 family)